MSKRKIIKIDEDKCNGCGKCIPNCAEGALQIINGKARLVNEVFCDGLGACLGHCPEGAITIEEREAKTFDASSCPGLKVMDFKGTSELRQWPVQLKLVPSFAPYLKNADLLIAADCAPFAYSNFHEDFLKGKKLLIGCPKLDDVDMYEEKFTQIFKNNDVKSVTCVHMEVPCCFGLVTVVKNAISKSGKNVPFEEVTVGISGERVE